MWTGAVYFDAAATQGMPVILWLYANVVGGIEGVGDEDFVDMVGDVAGDELQLK